MVVTVCRALLDVRGGAPGSLKVSMASKYNLRCFSVPRFITLPPQRLYWTPVLTICTQWAPG